LSTSVPTRGQLERQLSQSVQAVYRRCMGHQPSKTVCDLGDCKVTIVLEDSITQPEQVLAQQGQDELVKEVRSNLDEAFKPELKKTIEGVLGVQVTDILTDATLATGRAGIVIILDKTPTLRETVKRSKSGVSTSEPKGSKSRTRAETKK
jgi:uncharacterized protein YbcI